MRCVKWFNTYICIYIDINTDIDIDMLSYPPPPVSQELAYALRQVVQHFIADKHLGTAYASASETVSLQINKRVETHSALGSELELNSS